MRILEKVLVQAAIAKCQTGWLKCHLFCTLLKVGKFKFKMLADVVLGKSLLPGLQCVSVYDRGRKEFFMFLLTRVQIPSQQLQPQDSV